MAVQSCLRIFLCHKPSLQLYRIPPGVRCRHLFLLFLREKKFSALQVVNAKVRFGRISVGIDGSGQEQARLASLKGPFLGLSSGALCSTLIP